MRIDPDAIYKLYFWKTCTLGLPEENITKLLNLPTFHVAEIGEFIWKYFKTKA
jgi:hypothetical protein